MAEFDTQTFFREHLTKDAESGKTVIKDSDALDIKDKALLELEIRRRGSQSVAHKAQLEAEKLRIERVNIQEELTKNVPLTDEALGINPTLRYTDPDAYVTSKLEAMQTASVNPYQSMFDTASQKAQQQVTQKTLETMIEQHNTANPKRQITQEMLDRDLPPRLVEAFTQGQMEPEELLLQASEILYKGKAVYQQETLEQPNLGDLPGSTTPSGLADADLRLNYESAIF